MLNFCSFSISKKATLQKTRHSRLCSWWRFHWRLSIHHAPASSLIFLGEFAVEPREMAGWKSYILPPIVDLFHL